MTMFAELSHFIVEEIARVWGQDDGDGEKSFQFYVEERGIRAAARRKALLLHCAGMEVQEIFETLTDPSVPKVSYENQHHIQ